MSHTVNNLTLLLSHLSRCHYCVVLRSYWCVEMLLTNKSSATEINAFRAVHLLSALYRGFHEIFGEAVPYLKMEMEPIET